MHKKGLITRFAHLITHSEVFQQLAATLVGASDIVNMLLQAGTDTEVPPRCEKCIPPIFENAGAKLTTRYKGTTQLAFVKSVGDHTVIKAWLSVSHRGFL